MFKKVRSLLVAGALVLGMTLPVHAAENCLFGNVGVHGEDGNHYIEKADMIVKDDFHGVITELKEREHDGYIVEKLADAGEYDEAWAIYGDANYNNNKDEGEQLIGNVYINFADGVVSEKGWVPDLTPGTGDPLVIGGALFSLAAAGGLFVVNRKRRK